MKHSLKDAAEEWTPPPPLPELSKLQPPPTDSDRMRDALKKLDRLNCEYEIIYGNVKYTRKLNQHEPH